MPALEEWLDEHATRSGGGGSPHGVRHDGGHLHGPLPTREVEPERSGIVHARDPQAGEGLLQSAKDSFNVKDTVLTELSLSLATNFGHGTVGIVLYPAE